MNRLMAYVCGAGLLMSAALSGAGQEADGARRTVDFTITYRVAAKGSAGMDRRQSSLSHILEGRCVVEAGMPEPWGIDGPTRAQERAQQQQQSRGRTGAFANVEAEVKKCGKDTNCIMAVMNRLGENGAIDAALAEANAAGKTDANFQNWRPLRCSGSLTVDDTVTTSGRDTGVGTEFAETQTVKGAATITDQEQRGWLGLYAQHDLKKGVSELRFVPPSDVRFEISTVRTGDGARSSTVKQEILAFPSVPHPSVTGPLQSGKTVRPVAGGSVTFEWTVTR